jgi:hypothetical protein
MSLISIIVALVVVGVVLWLINTYVPMDPKIKGKGLSLWLRAYDMG